MVPGPTKRPVPPRRNRKRKRRNVSSSSSSSLSDSDSHSENGRNVTEPTAVTIPQKRPPAADKADLKAAVAAEPLNSDDDSTSSESETTTDSDSDSRAGSDLDVSAPTKLQTSPGTSKAKDPSDPSRPTQPHPHPRPRPPSPPPPHNVPDPNILENISKEEESALRARFRQFYLGCVADAFTDDLNEIRKEPNLTPARLSLLIDSLAAGADVYAPSSFTPSGSDGPRANRDQVNEMELVLAEEQ